MTLCEFDEDLRASVNSPAVQPMLVHSSVHSKKRGFDYFMEIQLPDREKLIAGVPMYVKHLDCVAMVFSVFHAFQGVHFF